MKWIPVTERLPELDIKVLGKIDAEEIELEICIVKCIEDKENNRMHWIYCGCNCCYGHWEGGDCYRFKVTHWMPLPEKPLE